MEADAPNADLHVAVSPDRTTRLWRSSISRLCARHSGLAGHSRLHSRLTVSPRRAGHSRLHSRLAVLTRVRIETRLCTIARLLRHSWLGAVAWLLLRLTVLPGVWIVARLLRLTVARLLRLLRLTVARLLGLAVALLGLLGLAVARLATEPGLLGGARLLPVGATRHELRLPEVGLLSRTRGKTVAAGGLIHDDDPTLGLRAARRTLRDDDRSEKRVLVSR